jgi:LL-diaminopimelate aminotransferase
MKINPNFALMEQNYLFATVEKKVAQYKQNHEDADIIKMGIGDVTRPLCKSAVIAMQNAVLEMADEKTFRGYGPYEGYEFARKAIQNHYLEYGINLSLDEIFVGDGGKSDVGNIVDLFDNDNTVLIPDPVYPVYVDTNTMSGRKIVFMNGTNENGFLPLPDENVNADIIYLCSPNNPTGAAYSFEQLEKWVDYANRHDAVILYDAAYEMFIADNQIPHSIFNISGARTCAIEFCSFSKTAGFTGMRCGYTVIPNELKRQGESLNRMWLRRQATKFNGVNYAVQRGAEAVFTSQGMKEIKESIDYYRNNAKTIMLTFDDIGIWYTGGINSPYIWFKVPGNLNSWEYFDLLLDKANIVCTPGSGFGKMGEGYIRLTSFGNAQRTKEAMERIKNIF